jgi:radical SAM superfamily enzyme YgiQ (UPF0313 family)
MGGAIFSQSLDVGSDNLNHLLERAPYIDNIIVGEGENLFLKYLQDELSDSESLYTLASIDHQLMDIADAPIPDYRDFDSQSYPYAATYSSRSCPFQCSFCAETVYWGKFRMKKSQQIIDEMEQLSRSSDTQLFLMCDSLLNPVINDLSRKFLESPHHLYWDGYLRADKPVCDRENTLLWRRGGFYRARLGLESGSPHVLEMMGKKTSPQQMKDAVSSLAAAGIKTTTYWVVGHPGETEEDFQETLDMVEQLSDDIYEAECNPFRYFLTGQVASDYWEEYGKIPLYPKEDRDMLVVLSWVLDCDPSWEVTLDRVNRFVAHCKKLGIPNPYSMHDIHLADERWKKLQKNAVPSVVEFGSDEMIKECKEVQLLVSSTTKLQHDGDWGF